MRFIGCLFKKPLNLDHRTRENALRPKNAQDLFQSFIRVIVLFLTCIVPFGAEPSVIGMSISISRHPDDQASQKTSMPFARRESEKEMARFQPRLRDVEFGSEHLMTLSDGLKPDWSVPPSAQMARNPAWWVTWIDRQARHIAVRAKKDKKMVIVMDGQISSAFDDIDEASFSHDGASFAFKAKQGGKWHMVVNNETGPAYEDLSLPIYSPQGGHLAYAAKQNGKWHMILDGNIGPPFDEIPFLWQNRFEIRYWFVCARFSIDGTRFAYAGKRGGMWQVVTDGREGSHRCENVSVPTFSPDGTHLAYTCSQEEGCLCILDDKPFPLAPDGKEIRFYNVTMPPYFSPDGNRLAFFAAAEYSTDNTGRKEPLWRMVLLDLDESLDMKGWKAQPDGFTYRNPYFNQEGWAAWTLSNWVGAGAIGKLYVNGERVYDPTKPMDEGLGKLEDLMELIGLYPGGYVAARYWKKSGLSLKIHKCLILRIGVDAESGRLVITERRDSGGSWSLFPTALLVGPDFRHLANEYQDYVSHIVADGHHGPSSDQIIWGSLYFVGPDELAYIARLDRSFYRITIKFPSESIPELKKLANKKPFDTVNGMAQSHLTSSSTTTIPE